MEASCDSVPRSSSAQSNTEAEGNLGQTFHLRDVKLQQRQPQRDTRLVLFVNL